MRTSSWILLGSIGILGVGWFLLPDNANFRWGQRLQITLATPGGPVEFTSFQNVGVEYFHGGQFLTGTEVSYSSEGQAGYVEIPNGNWVFALQSGPSLAEAIYREETSGKRQQTLLHIRSQKGKPPRHLEEKYWPDFVYFEDPTHPEIVFSFDQYDVAEKLGEGYSIQEITYQITPYTPLVVDITKVLPWLRLDGNPTVRLCADGGWDVNDLPLCRRLQNKQFYYDRFENGRH